MVFMPFCYAEAAANLLTNPALDPFGKIPEFKFCAVRAEKAETPFRGGVKRGRPASKVQVRNKDRNPERDDAGKGRCDDQQRKRELAGAFDRRQVRRGCGRFGLSA